MVGLLGTMTPYLKLFLYFGQSCYLPKLSKTVDYNQTSNYGSKSLLTPKIPTIIWSVLAFSINLALVWLVNFGVDRSVFDSSDAIITNIFILCQLTKTVSVFIQSVFYNRAIRDATQVFLSLETYFDGTLHHKIGYEKFGRQMFIKSVLICILYVQSAIFLSLTFIGRGFVEPITTIIKLSQIRSIVILIHIIFFIDLLRFHMVQLNAVIQRDANEHEPIQNNIVIVYRKSTKEMLMGNKYRNYKHVHYRLWNATQHINYYFGWSLTTVFLQTFVDCVYNSYWQYNTLNMRFNLIQMLRKFIATLVI